MINWINNATSTNGSSSTVTLNPNAAGFISMDVLAQISTLNGTFMKMEQKPGMPPEFFFKLMKKKMGVLKDRSYRKYLGKIEKMVDKANKDGQIAYSEDLMREFYVLLREAEMYGANFRIFLSECSQIIGVISSIPISVAFSRNHSKRSIFFVGAMAKCK